MKKIKIKACVIGLGNIGFDNQSRRYHRNHCDNYYYSDYFSLEGVTDINKNKKKKIDTRYKNRSIFYESIDKMITNCKPSIISICVPPDQTLKVLKKIKNLNKYFIFLEKPIANNNSNLKKIYSLLKLSKNKIIVNYFRAWEKNNINFIKIIKSRKKCTDVFVTFSKGLDSNASHIIYMLISLFGKHNEIRIINKHKFTPSFLIYFKPNIKVIFNGITDTKNNFCEANFITDNGVYSFEAAGCRYTFQKFKKNIFYNNYYQISNHQKILKEKELNIFGNISKKIYQNIILKSKNNISNFETGIEVTNILNYIKKRI